MATTKKEITEEVKEDNKPKKHKVYFEPSEFEGDDYVVFGMNGNITVIKRGFEVEVDDKLYRHIQRCRKADRVAADRLRAHRKELEKMAKL